MSPKKEPTFLKYLSTLKSGSTVRDAQLMSHTHTHGTDIFGFAFLLRKAILSNKWESLLSEAEEDLAQEADSFPESSPRHVLLGSRAASMEMIKRSILTERHILRNDKQFNAEIPEKERLRHKLLEALDDDVESLPLPGEIVNLGSKVPDKTFGPFMASLPMRKMFVFQVATGKKTASKTAQTRQLLPLYNAWLSGSHAALCGMITDLYPDQTEFIGLDASVAIEVRLDWSVKLLLFETF